MAILKVTRLGHPVLRQVAKPVPQGEITSPAIQRLIDDMIETMHEYDGVGIAAPQVFQSLQLAVIEVAHNPRYPQAPEIRVLLFQAVRELLFNVVKHANARQVTIRLESRPPNVRLTVEDDGAGFDSAAVPGGHLGLAGMRARAEKVGGTLSVASRKGRGTTIEAVVPADATHADGAGSAK